MTTRGQLVDSMLYFYHVELIQSLSSGSWQPPPAELSLLSLNLLGAEVRQTSVHEVVSKIVFQPASRAEKRSSIEEGLRAQQCGVDAHHVTAFNVQSFNQVHTLP